MQTEFSGEILFKDSEKNAYCLRVYLDTGIRRGCVDAGVFCDIPWDKLCQMLGEIEVESIKRYHIRKPINRGNLHLVR